MSIHAIGINARGDIAGYYEDAAGMFHGFTLVRGVYSTIDPPGSLGTGGPGGIVGINSREMVGFYRVAPPTMPCGCVNAEAEMEALHRIAEAIPGGDPGQYLITVRYIESLRDMTRTNNAKVIFMPVETSAMLSSVGAIKEVLSQTGEQSSDNPPPPPPRPRELPR